MSRRLILLLTLVITACSTAEPVPEDKFYRLLALAPPAHLDTPVLDGLVEVERFGADALVDKGQIVYSEKGAPQELEAYHYHAWTQTPVVMVRDRLVGYLRAANAATEIVTPEMRLAPDFVITGKIHRLERVLGTPSEAVVELELALREERTDKLILVESYQADVTAEGETVGEAVLALSQALDRIFARFLRDLSRR